MLSSCPGHRMRSVVMRGRPAAATPALCSPPSYRRRSRSSCNQLQAAAEASTSHSDSEQAQQALQVRSIRESDKPAWLVLFKDYIAWYKATVSDDTIELTWQRMMAGGQGNHRGLVAEDSNGQLLGIAHYLLHRSTWSQTHYCYLEDLYVHHEVRGGGIGQALIEAVYACADEQGATKTYWQTHEFNYRARGLYDKVGRKSAFILYERE